MRIVLLSLVLLLSGASTAAAAPRLSVRVTPEDGATLGGEHRVAGALTDGGVALAGQVITLEGRPAGSDAFEVLDSATTGGRGEYRFDRAFDRNHALRLTAAGASARGAAFVFPDPRLAVRTVRPNVVRITQSFPAEPGVPVRARSSFYLGRARAETARHVGRATVRRRGDRYLAQLTVRVPARYKRRFSYAACLQARAGSALGDPGQRCPRRAFRF